MSPGARSSRSLRARCRTRSSRSCSDSEPEDGKSRSLSPRPPGGGDPTLDLSDNRGDAVVGWLRFTGTEYAVQASYRPSLGPWQPGVDISPPGVNAPRGPGVAVDENGNAAAIWAREGPAFVAQYVQAAVRPLASGAWEPPVNLAGPYRDVESPQIAMDAAGNAIAAWIGVRLEGNGTVTQAVDAAYRPAGGSWASPVAVSQSAPDIEYLRLAIDKNGNALAIWRRAGDGSVLSAARPMKSDAWQAPVDVGVSTGGLDLDMERAGNAVAAWLVSRGGSLDVFTALRPAASGQWQAISIVTRSGGAPDVGIDSGGDAAVVWSGHGAIGSSSEFVEVAELTRGGPLLGSLTIPVNATVGVPAVFRVQHLPWSAPLAGRARWDFGDGNSALGDVVSHAYAQPGSRAVSVTQKDLQGLSSTSTGTIRVVAAVLSNQRLPSIRGNPRIQVVLICLPGRWRSNAPIRFAYRWLRDGSPIPGQRSRRYRIRGSDAGSALACRVTATNPAGSKRATSPPVRVLRG